MLIQFISWYLVVQLIALAALPWAMRIFANLPDRGYAFARVLGILLVGVVFWLGYSYGLIRNEAGGAWISLIVVSAAGFVLARNTKYDSSLSGLRALISEKWRYILTVEVIFLAAFVVWALVRAHDPTVDHTEEPMDLMFMNSIWNSATYPPQDAWLSGYAISYYYLGYWFLTTIGWLANQPPEIAYNLGQASWYGLLLSSCFGIVYNLLEARSGSAHSISGDEGNSALKSKIQNPKSLSIVGGILALIFVGMSGNMLAPIEWLHANGVDMKSMAQTLSLDRFLDEANVTNKWYIEGGAPWGWMWRTSRVLSDIRLNGDRGEVIDEYPLFSYILGDNHPHVLAMPFAILVIALALNLFLRRNSRNQSIMQGEENPPTVKIPLFTTHWLEWIVVSTAVGALIPLNTWDFPAYWMVLILAFAAVHSRFNRADLPADKPILLPTLMQSGLFAASLLAGALLIYFPYVLTAQSQAGGIAPNLFNPTRLGQFVTMFAPQILFAVAFVLLLWGRSKVETGKLAASLLMSIGLPMLLLAVSAFVLNQRAAQGYVEGVEPLPPDAGSYLSVIVDRWTQSPSTFLILGLLLGLSLALIWQRVMPADKPSENLTGESALSLDTFVLFLVGIGLLYMFVPEVVFLRDVFGSRMNTIFKFYYQSWLLLGLAGAYLAIRVLSSSSLPARLVAALGVILSLSALIVFPAAVYSRTGGFGNPQPTFDSTAYVSNIRPSEARAVEWIKANTSPSALILQAWGDSYRSEHNWISTATGRRTLVGWGGHEGQWRGDAYPEMSAGRLDALDAIYRSAPASAIPALLEQWKVDYVYVGGVERTRYNLSGAEERRLAEAMDLVFEEGDVRIYKRRSS